MYRILVVLLLLPAFAASAATASDSVPYDRLQQKSVHNAYQRNETITDMLTHRNIRSLELDIHVDKSGRPRLAGDWYVYHSRWDSKSSVDTLRQGLLMLKNYHDAQPDHEVITLWMDLKQSFIDLDHQPEDLDRVFAEVLGPALFPPSELLQRCPQALTLLESAGLCAWPTAAELRGRFLIVLTEAPNQDYVLQGTTATQRLAFIAPVLNKVDDILPYVVFYNLEKSTASDTAGAVILGQRHLVSRTWDLNGRSSWNKAVARAVRHLATDKVDVSKDTWSTTLQSDGGSFNILP